MGRRSRAKLDLPTAEDLLLEEEEDRLEEDGADRNREEDWVPPGALRTQMNVHGLIAGTSDKQVKQDSFVLAMLSGQSWRQAAAIAGIDVRTAATWLKSRSLQNRMSQCRDTMAEQALTRMTTLLATAIAALEDCCKEDKPPAIRIQAADRILKSHAAFHAQVSVERRLREIEENLGLQEMEHHNTKATIETNAMNAEKALAARRGDAIEIDLTIPGSTDAFESEPGILQAD